MKNQQELGSHQRSANIYKALMEQYKSRKFKLIVYLPGTRDGTLLHLQDNRYYYKNNKEEDQWLPKDVVENSPLMFEEVKEPEKKEVVGLSYLGERYDPLMCKWYYVYGVHSFSKIPPEQLPAIIEVINNALNKIK